MKRIVTNQVITLQKPTNQNFFTIIWIILQFHLTTGKTFNIIRIDSTTNKQPRYIMKPRNWVQQQTLHVNHQADIEQYISELNGLLLILSLIPSDSKPVTDLLHNSQSMLKTLRDIRMTLQNIERNFEAKVEEV